VTTHQRRSHPARTLIERYADADERLDEASVWVLEAHLETCPACRDVVAARVYAGEPSVQEAGVSGSALLARVGSTLAGLIEAGPVPAPTPRRWLRVHRRWAVWSLVPWLLMTALILLAALVLERTAPQRPSLVLLLAPVAPLLGVAAAWNRRTDPAWELVAGSPRSGLWLLLRRTVVVLVAVIPVAMAVSLLGGHTPVVWLLPCLALTTMTLALGGRFGLHRAAGGIAVGWVGAVLSPPLLSGGAPVVLDAAAQPVWLLVAVVAAALIVLRVDDYRRLASRQ